MGTFGIRVFLKSKTSVDQLPVPLRSTASYKIAIVMPVAHGALEEIKNGFIDALSQKLQNSFDVYVANGNRTLLRQQVEHVVSMDYDLVFTIATSAAVMVKDVCERRSKLIPIVAAAVDDPVGNNLIGSMQSLGNNMTVVASCDNFEEQIAMLQLLKPHLKRMLLIYNPTPCFNKKKDEILKICAKKNITLHFVEIFNLNDLVQKVPMLLAGSDTILILKDNLVVLGIESLVTLCNKYGITLYASDLNSCNKGAALSYGVSEYQYGVEAARKAYAILHDGKKPIDIPTTIVDDFKLRVNPQTMKMQQLQIDERLLFLMKSCEVI